MEPKESKIGTTGLKLEPSFSKTISNIKTRFSSFWSQVERSLSRHQVFLGPLFSSFWSQVGRSLSRYQVLLGPLFSSFWSQVGRSPVLSGSPVCSVKLSGYSGFCDQDPNWHPIGGKKERVSESTKCCWVVCFLLFGLR